MRSSVILLDRRTVADSADATLSAICETPKFVTMQAVDAEVLRTLLSWLGQGQRAWFATVIATWGSSPRPVGSVFACNESGQSVGSLSGGCIEDDLMEKLAAGELATAGPQFFEYGDTAEEAERLGLPCGGQLDIVVEPVAPDADNRSHFTALADALSERRWLLRTLEVETGERSLQPRDDHSPLRWDADKQRLDHTVGPRYHLFVIGAGMVSKYVAEFATTLDYQVTVCDPREQLLADFDVEGVRKVRDMPDDAIADEGIDAASAIVALTHDPRIDDMGLLAALKTDAFYVGAMGSSRTSANRLERLRELGMSDDELAHLRAPIGLAIGSKTPPEIALAVMAEITAVRKRAAIVAPVEANA